MHRLLLVLTPDPTWGERRVVCNLLCCVDAFARSSTGEGHIVYVFKPKFFPRLSVLSSASLWVIGAVAAPAFGQQAAPMAAATPASSGPEITESPAVDQQGQMPNPVAAKPVYGPQIPVSSVQKSGYAMNWESGPVAAPAALVQALDLVSRNYPSIRGARASLNAAASDVRGAKWQRFPSLSVETGAYDTGNAISPSVAVSAPLWTAGRINSTIRRANAAYDATDARYRETVLGLAVETTQLYFDIARLTRREALITESLEEHRALVASMERRVAQEVSPLADLELARSRVAQIEQELTVSRAQRQASLFAFAELVSDPNYNIGNVPDYIDGLKLADREKIVDEALGFDPSLQRLSSEIRAGEAEVAATKASLFPQLNAQYTYNDIVGSRVGVVARLETSAGLSRFSAVSSARSRVDTSIAQLATAQRQIRQRINNDMTEFDAAQARASVSRNASFTASNVSQSYMRQFIAGRRSWLDVMNSLRETLSARLGQADAEISAMSSYVRLSLRTGRWSPFVDSAK